MSIWVLKAIIQKTISFLPAKHKINYWFQKNITKGVFLSDEYFEDRLSHAKEHFDAYKAAGNMAEGHRMLELGTGWYPVIPLAMFLMGFDKIYTVDISPLCNLENFNTTLKKYVAYSRKGMLAKWLPIIKADRWEMLEKYAQSTDNKSFQDLLSTFRIELLIEDARKLPLEKESLHFITSNNTFEHIYPDVLAGILREFQRVLKKGGLMSHFIDMSDHFAHFDKKISIYHFLRFSESSWKWIDNDVQPMNRWRINQYKDLYKKLNIHIHAEHHRPGDVEFVKRFTLASPFREMKPEEVAVSHSLLVSVKK